MTTFRYILSFKHPCYGHGPLSEAFFQGTATRTIHAFTKLRIVVVFDLYVMLELEREQVIVC